MDNVKIYIDDTVRCVHRSKVIIGTITEIYVDRFDGDMYLVSNKYVNVWKDFPALVIVNIAESNTVLTNENFITS